MRLHIIIINTKYSFNMFNGILWDYCNCSKHIMVYHEIMVKYLFQNLPLLKLSVICFLAFPHPLHHFLMLLWSFNTCRTFYTEWFFTNVSSASIISDSSKCGAREVQKNSWYCIFLADKVKLSNKSPHPRLTDLLHTSVLTSWTCRKRIPFCTLEFESQSHPHFTNSHYYDLVCTCCQI